MKTKLIAVVLLLGTIASAQQYRVRFDLPLSQEELAVGPVAIDGAGNIYGATQVGGGGGTVYQVSPKGVGKIIHQFANGTGGKRPLAGVTVGAGGVLYGTTYVGGTYNYGTLFSLTPKANVWDYNVLHDFGSAKNGQSPEGPVTLSGGYIYGTTEKGGEGQDGTVFTFTLATGAYSFTSIPGEIGSTNVAMSPGGDLYVLGYPGGEYLSIYEVNAAGQESTLYTFTGGAGGLEPWGQLVTDAQGNVYGTAKAGGNLNCVPPSGCGVIYEVSPTGQETVLYTFSGGADGAFPAGLVEDSLGNFYGITTDGGDPTCSGGTPPGCGTIFELSTSGVLTTLYSFENGADGGFPEFPLSIDQYGNLYGIVNSGVCNAACALIYELSPN
jgi:uncharacterized repeat protein (TIGR03803 family)